MTTVTEMTADTSAQARARRVTTSTILAAIQPAPSKSDTVIKLLLRAKGATPLELITATDWQAHTVRAFLSGLRKKGRSLVRETRKNGGFAYRIADVAPPSVEATAVGDSPALVAADA